MFKNLLLVVILLIAVGSAQAGNFGNNGNFGNCGNNCTGSLPVYNICAGAPETITGVVTRFGIPGNGVVINTTNGDVAVYGMGPYWYWNKQNVARPDFGETVTAVIAPITTSTYKVLMSMTIGNDSIQLRDSNTCQPLWRGAR
ncbi:MAG TPA: hypothetical protein HPP56_05110 [Nitrospirae bacterium]|nr:hypothetical protein [Nitrospirota bacterium]